MDKDSGESRLFLAVRPCQELYDAHQHLINANAGLPGTRWVKPENLHLTVFFIGDADADTGNELLRLLPEWSRSISNPIQLDFDTFSFEGGRAGRPSMVWARFYRNEDFTGLIRTAADMFSPLMRTKPRFTDPVPHVTLARIRSGKLPVLDADIHCSLKINGFGLWKTIRNHAGVSYRILKSYDFGMS